MSLLQSFYLCNTHLFVCLSACLPVYHSTSASALPHLSLSLPFYVPLSLCLSVCLSTCPLSLSLPFYVSLSLCLSVCLSTCPPLSLSACLRALSLSLSAFLRAHSLPFYVPSLFLSLSLSTCPLSLSLSTCPLPPSRSLSLSLPVCVSLYYRNMKITYMSS